MDRYDDTLRTLAHDRRMVMVRLARLDQQLEGEGAADAAGQAERAHLAAALGMLERQVQQVHAVRRARRAAE
ncbi:hypothetical protein Q8F55_007599 [Vanrija albida]|uniref:Uncharacterized protein n=1 Tax=Vanrija albida TaxID=181172 RepID=A0ABR3PU10_9TREE